MMRCDVVVKTHFRDLAFCSYALRFIEKNWLDQDSQVIVLANADCRPVIEQWRFPERFRYFYFNPWPDGNQFQNYITLLLDNFSDAGLFAIFDSDTMLLEPMTVKDKMSDGCPILYCKLEEDMLLSPVSSLAYKLWFPIMERWLGQRPPGDFMWAFPFVYFASSLAAVRRLVTRQTGLGLAESLYSGTVFDPSRFVEHPFKFCEHNVIGFYCFLHERERYCVLNLDDHRIRKPSVRQYHSWSGFNEQIRQELELQLQK